MLSRRVEGMSLSESQDISDDEQLLKAAALFLIEGSETYPAHILLRCSIDVKYRRETYTKPKPSTTYYADISLDGPRTVYDALERLSDPVGMSIRRAFSAVIKQGERLGRISARVSQQAVGDSDWRNELLANVAEIELRARTVLVDEGNTVQPATDAEQSTHNEEQGVMSPHLDARNVFVVHGRNMVARDEMFIFLRSIGLRPLEWSQVVTMTGIATPYIGDILETAFSAAQAVVVLLTPDDEARLREMYRGPDEPAYEAELTPQARPNVLFEAGMAMGSHPDRTMLVQFGELRPFSDVVGRHVIKMDGSGPRRQDLAQRLKTSGCAVDLSGTSWHTAGNFLAVQKALVVPAASQPPTGKGATVATRVMPLQAPLLVPEGSPTFHDQNRHWLKWNEPTQSLTITNQGQSPAFNVAAVLYGCESYIIMGNRDTNSRDEHWTCWLGKSIAAGETLVATFQKGNGIFFDDNKHIADYTFNAPPQPSLGEIVQGKVTFRIARVVITCQDAGGQKHASIFDYLPSSDGWDLVAVLTVDADLQDLQG